MTKQTEQPKVEEVKELTPLEAFQQNSQIMYNIVNSMKAQPVLEREQQERDRTGDDVSALLKVEFPKEGGIHSWMEGHDYPYLGFPYADFVVAMDGIKKITKYFFQRLHYIVRTAPLQEKVNMKRDEWFLHQLLMALCYSVYRVVERHLIKPELYSRPVREIHRTLTEMAPLAVEDRGENRILQVRDILCMYLEFDNAYRFRFQDMFEELDREKAIEDPAKEVKRLYEINVSREVHEEVKEKQAQYGDFFQYLFSIPRGKQLASEFFKRLNLEEVKLSEIDRHWCQPRSDYHFGFCERGELKCKKCNEQR